MKIKTEPAVFTSEDTSENQLPVDEDRMANKQKTTLSSEMPPPSGKTPLDGVKAVHDASSEVLPSNLKRVQTRSGSHAGQHPLRESQTSCPAREESEHLEATNSPLASILVELKAEHPLPGHSGSAVITLAEGQVCKAEADGKADSLQDLSTLMGLTAARPKEEPGKTEEGEAQERPGGDSLADKKRRRKGDAGDGGDSSKRQRICYPAEVEVARGGYSGVL